jgi:hypothetical protein
LIGEDGYVNRAAKRLGWPPTMTTMTSDAKCRIEADLCSGSAMSGRQVIAPGEVDQIDAGGVLRKASIRRA